MGKANNLRARRRNFPNLHRHFSDDVHHLLLNNVIADLLHAQLKRHFSATEILHMKEVVRAMSVNGRYYVSSACTGANISFICQAVLVYIITDGECYAVDAFNCEFDKVTQDFLVNNMDAHPFNNRCEPSPCVHPDLLDLDKSSAVCLAHHGDSKNTHCKIRFSSQNSTGFSCKDLSLMNNNRGKFKSVVKNKGNIKAKVPCKGKSKGQSPTSGGSTGKTADGLVRHLGCHQVPCGLAENVLNC